ncbi:MAG TPA: hypothetical protein VLB69_05530, partial [Rudaea sp.]|nr:hypothetical protein [Rudaea sp.]
MTMATSRTSVPVCKSAMLYQLSSFPRKRESMLTFGRERKWIPAFAGMTAMFLLSLNFAIASEEEEPVERTYIATPAAPAFQTWDDAQGKSAGCVSCHTASDRKTMHANEAVVLGCTDCHGGDAKVAVPPGETYASADAGGAKVR